MRFAIPEWQGQVSPVFDVASRVLIVDVEQGREIHREVESLAGRTPEGRARRLGALDVDMLVCGAISSAVEREATAVGVHVLSLVTGPVDAVVRIVARDQPLPEMYLMPGCQRHSHRAASDRSREASTDFDGEVSQPRRSSPLTPRPSAARPTTAFSAVLNRPTVLEPPVGRCSLEIPAESQIAIDRCAPSGSATQGAHHSVHAAPRVERRDPLVRERLLLRIRGEFREMPGLCLTVPQAARLFGIQKEACTRIFTELAGQGVLGCTARGLWIRCDRLARHPCTNP